MNPSFVAPETLEALCIIADCKSEAEARLMLHLAGYELGHASVWRRIGQLDVGVLCVVFSGVYMDSKHTFTTWWSLKSVVDELLARSSHATDS